MKTLKRIRQIIAWVAVVLVLGVVLTHNGSAYRDQSGSCQLAPWTCVPCHVCGDITIVPSFSYYQDPYNFGFYGMGQTIFVNTLLPPPAPIFYHYTYYDPSSGWRYQKDAIFNNQVQQLYSNQQFGYNWLSTLEI